MNRLHSAVFILLASLCVPTPGSPQERISEIFITGNHRTREEIVRLYLGLEPGMPYDSTVGADARKRLERTNAFHKVALLTVQKTHGVDLYVVLTEKPSLSLTDASAQLNSRRYGKTNHPLLKAWSASVAVRLANFRGRMEALSFSVRFWEWRSLHVSWHKPFLPSNWFLVSSAGVSSGPELTRPRQSRTLSTGVSLGREWPQTGFRSWATLAPRFRHSLYRGQSDSVAVYDERRPFLYADTAFEGGVTLPADSLFSRTRSWNWTGRVGNDSIRYLHWRGDSLWEHNQNPETFFETFVSLSALLNRTTSAWPKNRGWLLYARAGYNLPVQLSRDDATSPFLQVTTELRWYHTGLLANDSWAHRIRLTARSNDGGLAHLVTAGAETTVRGYADAGLGTRSRANNAIMFTTEYRFPLVTTPSLPLPTLAALYTPLSSVHYRFDGALFADAALLWHEPLWTALEERRETPHEIGCGIGAGIRMLVPLLERSICFDVVPLIWDVQKGYPRLFYPMAKERGFRPVLPWHLYVDLSF